LDIFNATSYEIVYGQIPSYLPGKSNVKLVDRSLANG